LYVVAIDAGGLTGGLTVDEQSAIDTILLTHYHFDHIRYLPFIGLPALESSRQIAIHCTQLVYDALLKSILNEVVWLNLFRPVPGGASAAFAHRRVSAGIPFAVKQYEILPLDNRHHPVPVIAYQLTGPDGRRLLYTGDTGPGIRDVPQALTDGYSTYRGLGLGLPGARRLMDEFAIVSEPDRGTTVTMTKWRNR